MLPFPHRYYRIGEAVAPWKDFPQGKRLPYIPWEYKGVNMLSAEERAKNFLKRGGNHFDVDGNPNPHAIRDLTILFKEAMRDQRYACIEAVRQAIKLGYNMEVFIEVFLMNAEVRKGGKE